MEVYTHKHKMALSHSNKRAFKKFLDPDGDLDFTKIIPSVPCTITNIS